MRSRNILAAFFAVSLCILFLLCLFAPWVAPFPFRTVDLANRLQPPSAEHWLGTDELGRDILSRLLYGGRVSFVVSVVVVLFSLMIGVLLGSLSAFSGGWLDEAIMRFADILLAFPGILLAIGLMAVLGPDVRNVVLALVAIGWISYARLTRALTLKLKELDFVNAARSYGASTIRLFFRHMMPNMIPTLMVQASFGFAGIILAESALSFLGLGVQPPNPSWGSMLSDGKNHLLDAAHLTIFPGVAIFFSVLAFNILGDLLRDKLDPRFGF